MDGIRAHVLVDGNVQGVFYRVWAKSNAKDLCLNGWVKNRDDGKVEAILEGDKHKVEEMLKRMQKGSDLAEVKNVDYDFSEMTNEYNEFQIVT